MAGTTEGGKKAAAVNMKRYGKDFYARIGSMGGKIGRTGGFHHMSKVDILRHREVSSRGGRISSRAGIKNQYSRKKERVGAI